MSRRGAGLSGTGHATGPGIGNGARRPLYGVPELGFVP